MTNGDSNRTIGLCLSGGGYRASFFHLGVLRYLAEAGQLANIQAISTVSGGSIAGTFLATKWDVLKDVGFTLDAYMNEVYDPFVQRVTTGNFRNRWLGLSLLTTPLLLWLPFTWIKLWSWFFDRWFYGNTRLNMHQLPAGLDLAINATSLQSARAYRFARTYRGEDSTGYSEDRPYDDQPVRVSDAVTASSAHLPLYIPLGADGGQWFVDGGVYDNTGLDWFLDWEAKRRDGERPQSSSQPAFLIASDASPELRSWEAQWWRQLPVLRILPVAGRVFSIIFEQTRRTRKDWFIDRIRPHEKGNKTRRNPRKRNEGIIISIDQVAADLGEIDQVEDSDILKALSLPEPVVDKVRAIRTDMDSFLEVEAELLAYHGYSLMHVYLKVLQKDTKIGGRPLYVQGEPRWKLDPPPTEIAHYEEELKNSAKRFDWRRRFI